MSYDRNVLRFLMDTVLYVHEGHSLGSPADRKSLVESLVDVLAEYLREPPEIETPKSKAA